MNRLVFGHRASECRLQTDPDALFLCCSGQARFPDPRGGGKGLGFTQAEAWVISENKPWADSGHLSSSPGFATSPWLVLTQSLSLVGPQSFLFCKVMDEVRWLLSRIQVSRLCLTLRMRLAGCSQQGSLRGGPGRWLRSKAQVNHRKKSSGGSPAGVAQELSIDL